MRARVAALAMCAGLAVSGSACMGYPMEGAVQTPAPPGSTGESRLPSLLSQLQGAGAGMEVFDGSQNEVLGAQDGDDAQGTSVPNGPTATATPSGNKVHEDSPPTPTPVNTVVGVNTPRPNPTPEGNTPPTATPTATPTQQQSEATPTPSPTPTSTPTPTATPTPNLPPSETGGGGGVPETEAD